MFFYVCDFVHKDGRIHFTGRMFFYLPCICLYELFFSLGDHVFRQIRVLNTVPSSVFLSWRQVAVSTNLLMA